MELFRDEGTIARAENTESTVPAESLPAVDMFDKKDLEIDRGWEAGAVLGEGGFGVANLWSRWMNGYMNVSK